MSNATDRDAQERAPEDQDQVSENDEERILRIEPDDVDLEDELTLEQSFDTQSVVSDLPSVRRVENHLRVGS